MQTVNIDRKVTILRDLHKTERKPLDSLPYIYVIYFNRRVQNFIIKWKLLIFILMKLYN